MSQTEILAVLTEIVHQVFGDDSIQLTPETTADDVEGWDSFAHINILVAAEVRLGIRFQTAEVEELRNVAHLIELISKKLEGNSGRQSQP